MLGKSMLWRRKEKGGGGGAKIEFLSPVAL